MGINALKSILTGILLCAITALGAPIQHQHAVVAKKMAAAGGGFSYTSTLLVGDYLLRGGDPVPDGKKGLLSFWIKMDSSSSDTTEYYLAQNSSSGIYFRRLTTGMFQFVLTGAGNPASNAQIIKGAWHHLIVSWDAAINAKGLYIDGVDRLAATTLTDATIDYASGNWSWMALVNGNSKLPALICELYFTDEYLDLSSSGNRDKFFNSGTSKPVDLGADGSTPTGTQPRIYLRNEFSTFQNNLGSGGNFSVTGTLADGGADKP